MREGETSEERAAAAAAPPNPLHDVHERAGAEFQPYDRLEFVSTFGDPQSEYAALRTTAGLTDQPHRGILEVTGKDRLPFLNNLITNGTWDKQRKAGLDAGTGVYAFFLNLKGRVVTDMNVLERGDRTLLEMDARLVEPIRAAFDKYLFTEQVTMTSRVGALHQIAIHGPRAAAVLAETGAAVDGLGGLGSAAVKLFGFDVTVWRDDPAGVPGYHVVTEAAAARAVWMNLLATFGEGPPADRRLRPVGWAAFNAARIEAGRPLFGIDFEGVPVATAFPARKQREAELEAAAAADAPAAPGILPAETGFLQRAVSFTKGCYLGQEVVARMYARGQVARQIVGLQMEDDALPVAGSGVFDDKSNQVGAITSSTVSPALSRRAICLAFVKKPFITPGSVVTVPAEGSLRKATVVALPFVKPEAAATNP